MSQKKLLSAIESLEKCAAAAQIAADGDLFCGGPHRVGRPGWNPDG